MPVQRTQVEATIARVQNALFLERVETCLRIRQVINDFSRSELTRLREVIERLPALEAMGLSIPSNVEKGTVGTLIYLLSADLAIGQYHLDRVQLSRLLEWHDKVLSTIYSYWQLNRETLAPTMPTVTEFLLEATPLSQVLN